MTPMRVGYQVRLLVMFAATALVVAACAGSTADTTTSSTTTTSSVPTTTQPAPDTTTTVVEPTDHVVYFLADNVEANRPGPFLIPVYRVGTGPEAGPIEALDLLFAGPSPDEVAGIPSISTAIPEGTQPHGITVSDGVASVDLSGEFDDGGGSASMFARLAQVVYTLTALPDIDEVSFVLDGEPVTVFSAEGIVLETPQTRADYYDLLPLIFVDSPAWGQPVTSPFEVRGLSNAFEATSQIMLTDDDGEPLFEETVTATCGTGCWGEWHAEISYTVDREQAGAVIAWEYSANDGSQTNIREHLVFLR